MKSQKKKKVTVLNNGMQKEKETKEEGKEATEVKGEKKENTAQLSENPTHKEINANHIPGRACTALVLLVRRAVLLFVTSGAGMSYQ